jgi:hypothetical protein
MICASFRLRGRLLALERIHLQKLLKILFLDARKQRSAVLRDIREDRDRESRDDSSGGGDFYGPFWADAKDHVFGTVDLTDATAYRIEQNWRRKNLYPKLRDGFLLWWRERRRWTNQPFRAGRSIKARFPFPGVQAVVKVEGVLSVLDGLDAERFIYPYFAQEPPLSEHAARLGLWLLVRTFPTVAPDKFRILDVIRGQTFSIDRTSLLGNEEADFRTRYLGLLRLRDQLNQT